MNRKMTLLFVSMIAANMGIVIPLSYQNHALNKSNDDLNYTLEETIEQHNGEKNKLEKDLKQTKDKLESYEDIIKDLNDIIVERDSEITSLKSSKSYSQTSKKTETSKVEVSKVESQTSKPETSKPVAANTDSQSSQVLKLSPAELDLFERLVECESGAEPGEGQIAVANVVINRVKSSSFPNTLTGVIYQDGQFSPVASGFIDNVTVSDQVKESVQKALNGASSVDSDTLYFFATWVAQDNPIRDHVTITKTIGGHHFGV